MSLKMQTQQQCTNLMEVQGRGLGPDSQGVVDQRADHFPGEAGRRGVGAQPERGHTPHSWNETSLESTCLCASVTVQQHTGIQ